MMRTWVGRGVDRLIEGDGRRVLRIVLFYAFFSASWIVLSDRVVQEVWPGSVGPLPVQTVKGWGFVVVSTAFLYWIARRELRGRHLAEAALEEGESRFRALTEHASDIIHVVDGEGRIRYMSPSVERSLGYRPQEMMGELSFEYVHPDDRDVALAAFGEALQRPGTTKRFEVRLRHKEGSWRTFDVIGKTLLEPTAELVGIVNSRDITEQRRAEEDRAELERQLRQSQKMEAIGRLAGGVAHDFNNLLTVITGYANILLDRYAGDEHASEDLAEIRKAAARASALTHQLLAFGRRQVLQPTILDLNAVVRDTEKMLQRVLREDIHVTTVLDPELGQVEADPVQMQQVIMNLATNARDAMPTGGNMLIETRNVELGEEYRSKFTDPVETGSYVMLAISDTGLGMAAEVQEHIFDPFFTTKDQGMGTGLGLSSVYGTVRQSDGTIWTYSELGIGTIFKILLPRVEAPVSGEKTEEGGPGRDLGGSETILVVENDDPVRKMMRRSLERFGYCVLEADGASAAMQVARSHGAAIDLVITDIVMHGLDGGRLAERIRPLVPGSPVLFISGYTQDGAIRTKLLDPGTPFLQKPFSPTELARNVRELLDAIQA